MIKLNSNVLTFKKFPNGETLIDGNMISNYIVKGLNHVDFKYIDDSDLIKLWLLKKQLDVLGAESSLLIYYMPYSRMDRVEGNSVFTLKYISELINMLNFKTVEIVEPHSDVTPALINNSSSLFVTFELLEEVIKETNFDKEKDYVFFPDAGAAKRYSKSNFKNQLVGYKKRDFETGRILDLKVIGDIKEQGFKVIIIDDLCSRGGTFMLSAEALKKIGANDIYLLVGHCEEIIYDGDILKTDLITKVFTTDSILDNSKHEKINIYKI